MYELETLKFPKIKVISLNLLHLINVYISAHVNLINIFI